MIHIYRICYEGKEWFGAYKTEASYHRIMYNFWSDTGVIRALQIDHFKLQVKEGR